MTLRDCFEAAAAQPIYVTFYFVMIIIVALLTGWLAKGEGEESPWSYLYSTLLYLVCVPGILAIALQVYKFLFERHSIFDMSLLLEIMPILSMFITILIVRKNVNIDRIPGFDKLSGLVMMIAATMIIMWFVDRVRIVVFSYMPIQYLLLIFAGLLLVIRFGWSRFIKS